MIGNEYNYEFGINKSIAEPQLLLNSDRITLNSRKESMFLSAYQNIYIGFGCFGCFWGLVFFLLGFGL